MRRRKFLKVAGAGVAPAAGLAQAAPALRLQFLGLELEVDDPDAGGKMTVRPPAPAMLPSPCKLLAWHVELARNTLYVRAAGLRYGDASVFLKMQIPVVRSGGVFRLKPGKHTGVGNDGGAGMCFVVAPTDSYPSGSGLRLTVGALPVEGEFEAETLVVDVQGGLYLRMASFTGHTMGRIAPIELIAGNGLVSLDLARGLAVYADGSVQLRTSTLMAPRPGQYWTPSYQDHALQACRFSLNAVPRQLPLRFTGSARQLPLHVERLGRTVPLDDAGLYVGMYASAYDLVLAMTVAPNGAVMASALALVSRVDKGGALRLTTFAIADAHNVPVDWRLPPDTAIPLRVRWANATRPGTLLLDPPARAGNLREAGIRAEPDALADRRVHGDIADAIVHVAAAVYLKAAVPRLEQQGFNPGNTPANLGEHFAPALLAEATAPMFEWTTEGAAFERARPGNAYRGINSTATVRNYEFSGAPVALPMVALAHLDQASMRNFSAQFRTALDSVVIPRMSAPAQALVHESARQEAPVDAAQLLRLSHLFQRSAPGPSVAPPAPSGRSVPPDDPLELAGFTVQHLFSIPNGPPGDPGTLPLNIVVERPSGAEPDYIIVETDGSLDQASIPKLNFTIAINNSLIVLDPLRDVKGIPAPGGGKGLPRAVLKLSRNQSLGQILEKRHGYEDLARHLPSALQAPEWVGMILFGVPAMLGQADILASLLPTKELADLRFQYVAVTPRKQDAEDALGYSVAAYLKKDFAPFIGTRPATEPVGNLEAAFGVKSIEGRWDGSLLQGLRVDCMLRFYGFLGLQNRTPRDVPILGIFDRAANALKFSAQLDVPVGLLPDSNASDGEGPIKQVWFKGASVTMNGKTPHIAIDGSIELRPFKVGSLPQFAIGANFNWVDFDGLGIDLPDPSSGWRLCSISYPSIRVNFDGPRFTIGPLVLKLFSLGIDVDQKFDWGRLVMLKGLPALPDMKLPCLLFGVRIELMKLPSILSASVEALTFDLQIGAWPDLGRGHWPAVNLAAGLSALGFEKLNLNLFRFLEVSAEKAAITEQPELHTTWIKLEEVRVKVCGTSIFDKLNAAFFVSGGQSGFVLMVHWKKDVSTAFAVEWLLLGHNVVLPPNFIIEQMALTPPGRGADFGSAQGALQRWSDVQCLPATTEASSRDWLVGAGISALEGFFQGRFVYQEGQVCALSLQGEFLSWIGLETGIAGAYFKGRRPEDDHFYLSLTIPAVAIGPISFTGGVVAVDFGVNGNVQLDLGYPWQNPDGSRQWHRALGAIVTPFQGSGGFYVEHRRQLVGATGNTTAVKLAAGYAIQAGLGAVFGGGIFTAWVTIGIYATIEGDLYIADGDMVGLRLAGAIGVLFRGHAGLNWWVISIDIDIVIGAEAGVAITWASNDDWRQKLFPGPGSDSGRHIVLHFNFTVYASASASACIRLGFAKICKRISVSIPMRVQYALTM
jgi:hypothetical protein